MLRWIWRLSTSALRSDLRWLVPVIVCTSLSLGAFLPVFGTIQTVRFGALSYLRGLLGADIRVDLSEVTVPDNSELLDALTSLMPEGTTYVTGRTLTVAVAAPTMASQEPVVATVVVLDEPGYPYYGGNLWTKAPDEALVAGVALSTGLAQRLGVKVGDAIPLFGGLVPVAALSPDNLLSVEDAATHGRITALRSVVLQSGTSGEQLSRSARQVFFALPSGMDLQGVREITQSLVDLVGRRGVIGLSDLAPVVTSGLERLSAVFFWSSLIVLFICAFGIAFGLEDYARSHSLETAILRSYGASTSQVASIMAIRFILVGLVTAVLTGATAFLLRGPLSHLVGCFARDMVDLALPKTISWPLFLMGPMLIIAYGLYAFRITLGLKPFAILRQKAAGFPLLGRSEQSAWSALTVVLVTMALAPVLQKLLLGSHAPGLTPALWVLAFCLVFFLSISLGMTVVDWVGRRAPSGIRWALTYVRMGRSRLVITMTAVTVALSVGAGAVLLDRALTFELEQAISRQIPASTLAYYPIREMTQEAQTDLIQELLALDSVTTAAGGGLAVVKVMPTESGDRTVNMGSLVIKLVDPDHAGLFGSGLTRMVIDEGSYDPDEIPCSLVEEYATEAGLSVGDRIDVHSTAKAGGMFRLRVVAVEPYVGVRIGLLASASVPNNRLPAEYGVVVTTGELSRGSDVAAVIRRYLPSASVYDLGAAELVLRSLSRQLGFLWSTCAALSLLVALAVCFSGASISNIRRSAELALFRVLGASPRQTYAGPVAEALTQGLLCGLAGGGLVQLAFLKAIDFIFGIQVPVDAFLLVGIVAVSLLIASTMQIISVRRALTLSPLEVLRNE